MGTDRGAAPRWATELGTVYDLETLATIKEVCSRNDLRLHLDGARFANAVASLDVHPKEITWKAGVDMLSFGLTKNGTHAGEALVFFDKTLASEFDWQNKQAGQLASKMRFLAAPWVGLLKDGAWLRHATHANKMAQRLRRALAKIRPFLYDFHNFRLLKFFQLTVSFPDYANSKYNWV